jgi:hypothetical protein
MTYLPTCSKLALEIPTAAFILYLAWKSHHTHSAKGITFWLLTSIGLGMAAYALAEMFLFITMMDLMKANP